MNSIVTPIVIRVENESNLSTSNSKQLHSIPANPKLKKYIKYPSFIDVRPSVKEIINAQQTTNKTKILLTSTFIFFLTRQNVHNPSNTKPSILSTGTIDTIIVLNIPSNKITHNKMVEKKVDILQHKNLLLIFIIHTYLIQ